MNTKSFFDYIQTPDTQIIDNSVCVHGKPIGILIPSVIISMRDNGLCMIRGPKGIAEVSNSDVEQIWAALIATGSIIFGSEELTNRVQELLKDPLSSRNCAYFCAISESCEAVALAHDRIINSHVLVIGTGGIGSLSAMIFAGAGVNKIHLVDPDTIESSNLNRQFFFRKTDIGRHKVDVLAEAINDRFENIQVDRTKNAVTTENIEEILETVDAVLISADEPLGISSLIFDACQKKRIDALSCGYIHGEACIHFLSKKPSLLLNYNTPLQWQRIPSSVMPSFGPTNVEIAGLATGLLLQNISGMMTLNTSGFEGVWNTRDFPRRWKFDDCV